MHIHTRFDCEVGGQFNGVFHDFDPLDRDDAVATAGQDRTCHDLEADIALRQIERRSTRRLHSCDAESPRTRCVPRARERDAVHRDAIEGWLIALGVYVLREDGTGQRRERSRLDGQGRQTGQDPGGCFGRCRQWLT